MYRQTEIENSNVEREHRCRFLVWNICKNNNPQIRRAIISWVTQHEIDVIVLLECTIRMAEELRETLRIHDPQWRWLGEAWNGDGNNYLKVFSRLDDQQISQESLSGWIGTCSQHLIASGYGNKVEIEEMVKNIFNKIRHIKIRFSDKERINCFFVHFYSKMKGNASEQIVPMIKCLNKIRREIIDNTNAPNSLILWGGDFNLNPHDNRIHANFRRFLGDEYIPTLTTRKAFYAPNALGISNIETYFYNPSWLLLGDHTHNTEFPVNHPNRYQLSYSFYYDEVNNPSDKFFNLLDGVLIAKDLIPYFKDDEYRLLDRFKDRTGVDQYLYDTDLLKPDKSLYSDHFPFIFELDSNLKLKHE